MRIILAIVLAGAVASCTDAEILRVKKKLWPHDYPIEEAEPEVPMRLPPEKPAHVEVEPPPIVDHPVDKPVVAPVAPVQRPVVRPSRERVRTPVTPSRRIQPRETRKKLDAGPDLPWSCMFVRMRGCGKSDAELRKLGRENKVRLSPKQERQAKECLKTC